MLISQLLFAAAALVFVLAQVQYFSLNVNLLGFGFVCSGFAIGFGVTMSQALSPFASRAGVASSLLGIAQVCTSALYIWLMGLIGISPLNILLLILALGSVISTLLILCVPIAPSVYLDEEITRTS